MRNLVSHALAQTLILILASILVLPTHASEAERTLRLEIDEANVHHVRLEVFDAESGEALFDTGPVEGSRLVLRHADLRTLGEASRLRYEVRAWDASGDLVLSQLSTSRGLEEQIFAIDFESIPAGTKLQGGPITLGGDVEVAGTLNAPVLEATRLRDGSGNNFFGSCGTGQYIGAISETGTLTCRTDVSGTGGGDDLGDYQAHEDIDFTQTQLGLTAPGGARLRTGPLGATWYAQAGAAERHRFGVRAYNKEQADFVVDHQGYVGIGTFEPERPLDVRGHARFGNPPFDSVRIGADNNALIEMRSDNGGVPFIDFSNDASTDFDMRIQLTGDDALLFAGGRLGIGDTMTNPQYAIDLPNRGDALGRARANLWLTYSSARYKTNIRPLPDALATLSRLRGVEFEWAKEQGGGRGIGFLAEEVGAVLPEIVDWEENGRDAKAMSYTGLIPLLVEALKEQQAILAEREERITRLETAVCRLDPAASGCD